MKVKSIALALVTTICFATSLFGSGDGEGGWTPELSMKYKGIRATAISADGSLTAYVLRAPVMEGEKSEYLDHIWMVSSDGKTNLQYTRGEKSATNPAFSPDGNFLTFLSKRGEKTQIWMMRVRGGEAEEITDAENGVVAYRWSADGTTIAFTMKNPDTEEEKKAKKEKRDVILVDQNFKYNHLYTVTVARNENGKRDMQRLTSGAFHVTSFDWAPDGNTIAFAHQPDPRINTSFSQGDLSTVPSDSGAITTLVDRPGVDSNPAYSPDGKWIAFISNGGQPQEIGLREAYVISAKGGKPSKLADSPDRNTRGGITWSKDGKAIYISEAVHTSRHAVAVPVDGSPTRLLTQGEGAFGSVSFSRNGEYMAFSFQDTDTPNDVYNSAVHDFKKIKLTDLNSDLAKPQMGKTELLSWKSKDGLEIEGLLTYPVGYEKGRKYPLILNVHGGPAGVFSQTFTGNPGIYMIQYFAQNGYAVLRGNPRGSTGYGKKFRYANFRDWGFGDFEDIMSGVDQVIAMGVAHRDSLCLMGWSYGGYMTSYAVTKTDRFKAASMGAGLPNLISMTTTTDIPNYLVAHMGKEVWDDYKTYEKHSAIYRIRNVTTPTQVIHGAKDLRVPFTQGQEFYVALDRRGVPTEMIVYPRTPHGPREPKFLMDVSPRIMKWFERYLGRSAKSPELSVN